MTFYGVWFFEKSGMAYFNFTQVSCEDYPSINVFN